MDVLRLIIIFAVLGAGVIAYHFASCACEERFGLRPVTKTTMLVAIAAALLVVFGGAWRQELITKGGDVLNGTLLMTAGVGLALGVAVRNFIRFRVVFGSVATVLHIVLIPIGVVGLFVYMFLGILASAPDRNRR
ncbi:hypothetical protein [Alkalilimnicola sp. S0819]|uniref:hypothetical protein n=1 Tax=Alkalilimnicola sp. S0819 TaxID=2613922 RepID=UPI001261F02F|nr:hypothetical protein [Alkalilimnicola sp. S0819]KAB7619473.1 hypothetical protein F3N43_13710 [Alkalilimnicola sp. S0819]MPQ17693.1 hypothetical protein [Alkalilimnicola sp. S0819]